MAALNGQAITGDQVRFEDDERADKPDVLALQSLIFETMIRSMGGFVGSYGLAAVTYCGTLHSPSTSWNAGTHVVTFGAGLLLDGGTLSSPSGSPGYRVLRHDPTLSGQTSTLDLTSYSPATQCLIWARRTYTSAAIPGVPTDLDTRKRWNTTDNAEESFSTYTRFSERVQWTAAPATIVNGLVSGTPTYPGGNGWFPCYRVTWSAGTPSFTPVSAFDGKMVGTSFADAAARTASPNPGGSALAVNYLLETLRLNVAYMRDQTGNTGWNTDITTYRGLKQLDTDLGTAEADIVATDSLVSALCAHVTVTSFTIGYSGGSWVLSLPGSNTLARLSSWSRVSTGYFTFALATGVLSGSGGDIDSLTGVQVTTRSGTTGSGAVVFPEGNVISASAGTFSVQFLDDTGTAADPPVNGFAVAVTGIKA